jgi:Domain of unknown function (DUF4062)
MENTGTVRHLRVFIGSPSDVKDERALLYAICARLQYEPALRSSAFIEIVAWDGPYTTVPLLAQLDPQSAVRQGIPAPRECDVAVFVLWSRFGTPLPPSYRRSDGQPYRSGTEWEYEDAKAGWSENGSPDILLYRRTDPLKIEVNAKRKEMEEARRQFAMVDDFFVSVGEGGVNRYSSTREFEQTAFDHLRQVLLRKLESPANPRELVMEYLDGGPRRPEQALLDFLTDRRQDPQLRIELLRKLGKDAVSSGDMGGLEAALHDLVTEPNDVAVRAVRVAASLIQKGSLSPAVLETAAETDKWEVRQAVVKAAIIINGPESLDLIERVAGTLSYWLPVQQAAQYVVGASNDGSEIASQRMEGILTKFLTNPRLSDKTRAKLEGLLHDPHSLRPDPNLSTDFGD